MFGIDDAITAVTNLVGKGIDKIWPDATETEKAKLVLLQQELNGELQKVLGQLDINREEAKSSSIFVAGWRPFTGWVCGSALAYAAILNPIGEFIAQVGFGYTGIFPELDTTITMQALFGMLGLGAYRSFEKKNSVSRNNLKQ